MVAAPILSTTAFATGQPTATTTATTTTTTAAESANLTGQKCF